MRWIAGMVVKPPSFVLWPTRTTQKGKEGIDVKDVVYLAIGDLRVPFGEYEGDTMAYCRGIQAAFDYLGIDADVTEQIVDKLERKPQPVQKVFLLRVAGLQTGLISTMTGIPGRSVRRYAHERVRDVQAILRDYVKPVAVADGESRPCENPFSVAAGTHRSCLWCGGTGRAPQASKKPVLFVDGRTCRHLA